MTEEKIHQKLDTYQFEYYKAMKDEADSILKDLIAMKSIDKSKVEQIIARAKAHLNGSAYRMPSRTVVEL
jgi:hypothetical protein